jgi:hypothetical protein
MSAPSDFSPVAVLPKRISAMGHRVGTTAQEPWS